MLIFMAENQRVKMKQKTFVLRKSVSGAIFLDTDHNGVMGTPNRVQTNFDLPYGNGDKFDISLQLIKEGEMIELKIIKRRK